MGKRITTAQRIVRAEHEHARGTLGRGWNHVSEDIQEGLVSRGVLFALWNQDESISAERRVELLDECVAEIRNLFKSSKEQ